MTSVSYEVVTPVGSTVVKSLQLRKTDDVIVLILFGNTTLVTPLSSNVCPYTKFVTLSGIFILVSPMQQSNALPPILVTLSGIDMLVSP